MSGTPGCLYAATDDAAGIIAANFDLNPAVIRLHEAKRGTRAMPVCRKRSFVFSGMVLASLL